MKTPKVNMGVTMGIGSDRYPGTIVAISNNKKRLMVQMDDYKPGSDYDYYSNQDYIFERNTLGRLIEFSLRNNGRWSQKGHKINTGMQLSFKGRSAYQDPHF